MAANKDINLYNDNGTLKQNIGGTVSDVGGGSSYDQDLNTTDSPTFANIYAGSAAINGPVFASGLRNYLGSVIMAFPSAIGSYIMATREGTETLTNKTLTLPANEAGGAKLQFTPSGTATTSPANGDMQYTAVTPLFTTASGTGALQPLAITCIAKTDHAYTSNTPSLQPMFPSARNTFALAANTTYEFEFYIFCTYSSIDDVPVPEISSAGTLAHIDYNVFYGEGTPSAGNLYLTTPRWKTVNSVGSFFYPAGASTGIMAKGSGMLSTTTATTLTLSITWDYPSGTGRTLKSGSYFKIRPVGAYADGGFSIGPWS